MADNKEGMRTYAVAQKIIAERNEAISQARFWRASAIYLGISAIVANIVTVGSWSGWW